MKLRTTILAALPAISSVKGVSLRNGNHDLSRRETGIGAMCYWEAPSSAIIRDKVFIDGGALARANITALGLPAIEANTIPDFSYYLNLGDAFNITSVPFKTVEPSTPDPKVTDGFMAANDNSFWLYGGYILDTDSIPRFPSSDEVSVYDVYRQGAERAWSQGWQPGPTLGEKVNRYVTGGAGVNVRSLNQSFYFSGAHHKGWTEIRGGNGVRPQYQANLTSPYMIKAITSDQVNTQWLNNTIPSQIRPRVNAEMVYVPVGKLGVLVVVGGMLNAEWMDLNSDDFPSPNAYTAMLKETISAGPTFLRTVEIYDLDTDTWYRQNTTGDIPKTGLARHCAVVASAEDKSSHQIYVYGGYAGLHDPAPIPYYDDVWVLSIPSFEWIKVHNGSSTLARQGHKCVKPLPDQMMIIGGRPASRNDCIDMVRVFNLNRLEFLDSYTPATFETYKVPEPIYRVIGGNESGGATKVARWSSPTLQAIFVSDTPLELAPTWYPYSPSEGNDNALPSISIIETKTEVPKYVYPVVAVCVVLILGIIGGCIAFFCIRKKKQKAALAAAGNPQFQNEEKDIKYGGYPQYPSPHTSPYNTAGSMTTLGPTSQYGHSRQLSVDGHSIDHSGPFFHELEANRNPVELDAGPEIKLPAVEENGGDFSYQATPATEYSDPIATSLGPQPSQRTGRTSVFSEETGDHIVSPLSPDPGPGIHSVSINAHVEQSQNSQPGMWRKFVSKGSHRARGLSSSRSTSKSRTKSPTPPV